jgi:hypothetical protein
MSEARSKWILNCLENCFDFCDHLLYTSHLHSLPKLNINCPGIWIRHSCMHDDIEFAVHRGNASAITHQRPNVTKGRPSFGNLINRLSDSFRKTTRSTTSRCFDKYTQSYQYVSIHKKQIQIQPPFPKKVWQIAIISWAVSTEHGKGWRSAASSQIRHPRFLTSLDEMLRDRG